MNKEKAKHLQNVTILFDMAWDTYKKYFRTLMKINVIPVIVGLMAVSIFSMVGDFENIARYLAKYDFILAGALVLGVASITIVVASLNYIAQISVISGGVSHETDKTISVWLAYKNASRLLFPYFWVMILTGLIILAGVLLLVVPGIVFSVWFAFSAMILILGNERGVDALKKSKRYVRGIWFEVFLRFLAIAALSLLLNVALGIFKAFIDDVLVAIQMEARLVIDFIYQLVVTPYFVVYGYELYKDIVKAHETVFVDAPVSTPTEGDMESINS